MAKPGKAVRFKEGYYLHVKVCQKVGGTDREVAYNIGAHEYLAGCLQHGMAKDADGRRIVAFTFMSPADREVAMEDAIDGEGGRIARDP